MNGARFNAFKVPQMQEYLKERGISVTYINKPNLVKLCEAVDELNLPLDPDMRKNESVTSINQNLEQLYGFCDPFSLDGADGAFKHVGATLYEIESFEVKSVTDGENQWKKRPRSHDCPVPIKQMKIMKARYNEEPTMGFSGLHNFDPRSVDQRANYNLERIQAEARDLKKISPNLQALHILGDPNDHVEEVNKIDLNCDNLKVHKRVMDQLNNNDDIGSIADTLNNSSSDIDLIEIYTRGQSNNDLWFTMRKGIITASNFEKVLNAVQRDRCSPSLLKQLMGEYSNATSASLEWGRKKEETALHLYMKVNKKAHQKACMQRKGLLLYENLPYIGYSVDGIFTCKCHTSKVIEVKCPYSARFDNPKDVAEDKLYKNDYYHQIQEQRQMGIYGLDKCDLVIYTSKGICVTTVDFDPIFFNNMLTKLDKFYREHLQCTSICYQYLEKM
ncbi:unnamed protein product [Mytilus coruscus]|uniref:YqaJ viral recombinase domain-containing protein n=1 Tax=Mytilus coruscus TaxID=42192 RepID=A0A6J8DR41_MYTCO|nr:unnamed protein product [Mytilus coruscus]